jgi:hypothetical protein
VSINGISGLSGVVFPPPERSNGSGHVPNQTGAEMQQAEPSTAVAGGSGSAEPLSPSVLAALLGQELKLTGSSSGV